MNLLVKKEYKKYIILHTIILIIGIISGILIGKSVGSIGKIPFLEIPFYEYFFHNIKTCSILILIGILSYGLLTWIPLLYNGFILGTAISFLSFQYSALKIVILFSHGIFELPALIMSIYLGRMLSVELLRFIRKRNQFSYTDFLNKIIKTIGFISLFLLIASVIESFPR